MGPRSRAFTLIELLVVLSVLVLLLSLLLPALSLAREQAKSVKCLSNLRQMSLAAQAYASSYDNRYPLAYAIQTTPTFISYAWDFTTSTDWSTSPPTTTISLGILWDAGSTSAAASAATSSAGSLGAAATIQQCPSFTGDANWLSDPYTGYNYNTSYIGHGTGESIPTPARTTDLRNPASIALFGDGQYAGGSDKFMRAPFSNPADASFTGRSAGTQGFRHLNKSNTSFCDGHAEPLHQRYTNTYPFDQPNIAPQTGFLSPDNSAYGG